MTLDETRDVTTTIADEPDTARNQPSTVHPGTRGHTLPTLSAREFDVLQLVAEGNTDAQVGAALGLSINTVKVHTKGISKKWHCRNRVHMVIMALQWGLLDLLDLPAVSPSGLSRLTGHEAQVLALLSNNLSARAIAEELGVTAASVHSAEQRIRLKWNAGRRADILELGKRYLQALNDQQTP